MTNNCEPLVRGSLRGSYRSDHRVDYDEWQEEGR